MIDLETNLDGPLEAMAALRRAYPEAIDAALKMEAVNIQRSVAATMRGLRVKKYRFKGLNERGNEVWEAKRLAPLDPATKVLRSRSKVTTPGGVLGLDASVSIRVDGDGVAIGHKPKLRDWVLRWQNGVPQLGRDDPVLRHRYWYRYAIPLLAGAVGRRLVTDEEKRAFLDTIPEVSPERPFYDDLADVVDRDFPAGLGKVLGKILSGQIVKAARARVRRAP